jgi:hypothetical protein
LTYQVEDGIRFLIKVIEASPRVYCTELIVAGVISLIVGLIDYDLEYINY